MNDLKDAIKSFWGLAFTIVCGAVGCLVLPPSFTNTWRIGIFVGLLACYVVGFLSGKEHVRQKAAEELSAAKSEHATQIANMNHEIAEKNHEIDRLSTQLEAAKLRTKEDVMESMSEIVSKLGLQAEALTIDDLRDVVQAATDKLVTVEGENLRIGNRIIGTADDHDIKRLFKPAEGE